MNRGVSLRKRRIFTTILIILTLVVGIASLVLYKLGDRLFDEAIDLQIQELEQAMAQEQSPGTQISDMGSQLGASVIPVVPGQRSEQQLQSNNPQTSTTTTPTSSTLVNTNNQDSTTIQPNQSSIPSIQLTKEKLENAKDEITPTDKMTAAKMVLQKLSQSDIDTLTKIAAGGITAEEKAQIKAIVYSRFTQQEINEIKAMYTRYMK